MLNWYEQHESRIYVNSSFVELSRFAVTLRVEPPRSGANRHALFIVGGASMGNSLSGVWKRQYKFLWEFLYPMRTHIRYRINDQPLIRPLPVLSSHIKITAQFCPFTRPITKHLNRLSYKDNILQSIQKYIKNILQSKS